MAKEIDVEAKLGDLFDRIYVSERPSQETKRRRLAQRRYADEYVAIIVSRNISDVDDRPVEESIQLIKQSTFDSFATLGGLIRRVRADVHPIHRQYYKETTIDRTLYILSIYDERFTRVLSATLEPLAKSTQGGKTCP